MISLPTAVVDLEIADDIQTNKQTLHCMISLPTAVTGFVSRWYISTQMCLLPDLSVQYTQ
jgi:hypothetical protein